MRNSRKAPPTQEVSDLHRAIFEAEVALNASLVPSMDGWSSMSTWVKNNAPAAIWHYQSLIQQHERNAEFAPNCSEGAPTSPAPPPSAMKPYKPPSGTEIVEMPPGGG